MKIAFVTSELAGYVKAGGLGDVSAALPRALRQGGEDARVLMPYYGRGQGRVFALDVVGHLPGVSDIPPCEIAASATLDGSPVYFLICPQLYERPGTPYADGARREWPDNDLRFARLGLAAAQLAAGQGGLAWQPEIIHANDWPAALSAGYLVWRGLRVPSVFTIHNLAHQGLFLASRRAALAIPDSAFAIQGVEFYGQISFLKSGLVYSAQVTTVSPTYAREITTPQMGCGLHGLLAELQAHSRLAGIANGIGEDWAPGTDPDLVQNFPPDTQHAKRRNGDAVRREFGLADGRRPLFAMVSRLVHQKGVDLVAAVADTIVAAGGQVVLLGEGERDLEQAAQHAAARNPELVGVKIDFDEGLSRRMIAGSDFYLMPSRFEPCGLNQMYAQRYGSLPVAHATGGLADTIEDDQTGFLFRGATTQGLNGAVVRALGTYLQPAHLSQMQAAAMAKDFSWGRSAAAYAEIYRRALSG